MQALQYNLNMLLYVLVLCWQYADYRVKAQGKRVSCEALLNILGKIKKLYLCPKDFRPLKIPNLY